MTVDDGQAGEATLLQVRSKMYCLDKVDGETAWKERGAGVLKVNVPERCVEFDHDGHPMPMTFDASGLQDSTNDEEESGGTPKTRFVRLIMRQDSTLRLLLNTVLLPAMHFREGQTMKAQTIAFTALGEDAKPYNVQLKVCFDPTPRALFLYCRRTTDRAVDERCECQSLPLLGGQPPEGAAGIK